ncbi:hypothetical protein V8C37DRAFT_54200 [Trichoderma ceciliae]
MSICVNLWTYCLFISHFIPLRCLSLLLSYLVYFNPPLSAGVIFEADFHVSERARWQSKPTWKCSDTHVSSGNWNPILRTLGYSRAFLGEWKKKGVGGLVLVSVDSVVSCCPAVGSLLLN